jgi:hypothetical protein
VRTFIVLVASFLYLMRRSGDLFRIVHFHWSTSDPAFQVRAQGQRSREAPR